MTLARKNGRSFVRLCTNHRNSMAQRVSQLAHARVTFHGGRLGARYLFVMSIIVIVCHCDVIVILFVAKYTHASYEFCNVCLNVLRSISFASRSTLTLRGVQVVLRLIGLVVLTWWNSREFDHIPRPSRHGAGRAGEAGGRQ